MTTIEGAIVNVQNDELRKLLEPEPTRAWSDAAKAFAGVELAGDQHQPRFVPLTDLITGVATENKAKEFVAVWRIVRLSWLWRVFMTREPPAFASRKAWKSFANASFSAADIRPDNETSRFRVSFAEFLGFKGVLSIERETYSFLKEETRGPVHEKITTDMVREAVRELADLNFYFDMFEVEYRRTYDTPYDIDQRMRRVMSSSFTNPIPVPRSDPGDRAAWLVAVRDFMRPWGGKKPLAFDVNPPDVPTLEDVIPFESAIAHVYCMNVTSVLRRRPVLPRYSC